jgi:hypothetical protein
MKTRCESKDPNHEKYYVNRGITVCDEWKEFKAFYDDMAPTWKPGLWLERRNNELGYSRFNCKWATPREQANNKTNNRRLEFCGEKKTAPEWSRILGINLYTLQARIRRGWSDEDCLIKPISK